MLKDGIIIDDGNCKIICNQYSFCELIKHILKDYTEEGYDKICGLVENSPLAIPIRNAEEAAALSHESAYYWAMQLYYGNNYWLKGIDELPKDYVVYEKALLKRHNLKEPFIWE